MAGYADGVRDIHTVDTATTGTISHRAVAGSSSTTAVLGSRFSWRGFQYVLVSGTAGVRFTGTLAALRAHWFGVRALYHGFCYGWCKLYALALGGNHGFCYGWFKLYALAGL
jgi:hypothetical protein